MLCVRMDILNMNHEIRELEDNLLAILNESPVPIECKRLILALLATKCEIQANNVIATESITEKGELKDGTELEQST